MDEALRRCPFLGAVARLEGCPYAQRLAAAPFACAAASSGPVLEEEGLSGRLHAAARLFHGPDGVVPLARFAAPEPAGAPAAQRPTGCPFRAAATATAAAADVQPFAGAAQPTPAAAAAPAAPPAACRSAAVPLAHPLGRAPLASISISGFGFVVRWAWGVELAAGAGGPALGLGRRAPIPRRACAVHGVRPLHLVSTCLRASKTPPLHALLPFLQPDPGQFFNRPARGKKQQPQQRKPADPAGSSGSTSSSSGGSSGASRGGSAGSAGARPGAAGAGAGVSSGGSSGSGAARLRPGSGGAGHAGQPGWKRVVGGLLPLAAGGHLACPAPIVKMRAAVAALKPVRDLRPQALPIRCALGGGGGRGSRRAVPPCHVMPLVRAHTNCPLTPSACLPLLPFLPRRALAMSGTAIAAGLPCGAWREHTRKFSPQWFLAVHAAIPFVAMLRKAVLMPRWAILLTLLGSSECAGCDAGGRAGAHGRPGCCG